MNLDPIPAIAACTGLYGLANYFRVNRLTIVSLIWGLGSCLIVLQTNSIVPVIVIHLTTCLVTEWLSIKYHMEMYVRRT